MSHEVVVHPKAVKRLNRLPEDTRELIKARLQDLSKEFGKPGSKLDIRKLKSEKELFRLRIGDYRVVFEVADEVIWVARVSQAGGVQGAVALLGLVCACNTLKY